MVVGRADGLVLACERVDHPGAWQFPQGGIDEGEEPVDAAWRELDEEVGLRAPAVRLVEAPDEWIAYELPPESRRPGRRGQVQRWFAFDLVDGSIEPVIDGREFRSWRWMTALDVASSVVGFRRSSYRRGLAALGRPLDTSRSPGG